MNETLLVSAEYNRQNTCMPLLIPVEEGSGYSYSSVHYRILSRFHDLNVQVKGKIHSYCSISDFMKNSNASFGSKWLAACHYSFGVVNRTLARKRTELRICCWMNLIPSSHFGW